MIRVVKNPPFLLKETKYERRRFISQKKFSLFFFVSPDKVEVNHVRLRVTILPTYSSSLFS